MPRLTPSSFAVLALLAMRPWTAYELNKQMRDVSRMSWSRTDAWIYQEPKRLVAEGFATATEQSVGSRKRTEYAITDSGRTALAEWFERPSAPPVHDFEALLKTGFAEFGSRESLIEDLRRAEEHAASVLQSGWESVAAYYDRVGLTSERVHNMYVYAKFVAGYVELIANWSQWARAEIESRPSVWPEGEAEAFLAAVRAEAAAGGDTS